MVSAVEILWSYDENTKWFNSNYEQLKKTYCDEWVAVLDKTVVDHDQNLKMLVKRLREKHSDVYPQIVVEYISTKDVELLLLLKQTRAEP